MALAWGSRTCACIVCSHRRLTVNPAARQRADLQAIDAAVAGAFRGIVACSFDLRDVARLSTMAEYMI